MDPICRIALLMSQDNGYCRGLMRGVHAFAIDRPDWVFRDGPPEPATLGPLREWAPDGIIVHLWSRDLIDPLLAMRTPVVNTTNTFEQLGIPLVEVDHLDVGRLAAEHFLDRGFTSFGYFGSAWTGFSKQREQGFHDRIARAGHAVSCCYAEYLPRPASGESWKEVDRQVKAWLGQLRKPAAVLASNDIPARHLSDICRESGLRVPDDVALLGVDNDELECNLANPPLSSVVNPSEQIGFKAAEILDDLIRGKPVPNRPVLFRPERVVTRQSSDTVAVDDADVSTTVAYIRRHATENIGVASVTKALLISRRRLERKFRKLLGRSVLEEIQRVRIEQAKRLLAETELLMPAIAHRSGFATAGRLTAVFRQATGTTPTAYRRQCQLRQQ